MREPLIISIDIPTGGGAIVVLLIPLNWRRLALATLTASRPIRPAASIPLLDSNSTWRYWTTRSPTKGPVSSPERSILPLRARLRWGHGVWDSMTYAKSHAWDSVMTPVLVCTVVLSATLWL